MPAVEFVLASRSPRRAALVRSLGLRATLWSPDLDERERPGESPREHVGRLAAEKARAAEAALRREPGPRVVLGADTVVVVGNEILGKPRDAEDARRMLCALAGRAHEVLTGLHLLRSPDGTDSRAIERTEVRFRPVDPRWIDWYVATGEPFGKAGAYGIQGKGALLCAEIRGSWTNVVGLPVEALPALFAAVGDDFLARLSAGDPAGCPDLGILSPDDDERTS